MPDDIWLFKVAEWYGSFMPMILHNFVPIQVTIWYVEKGTLFDSHACPVIESLFLNIFLDKNKVALVWKDDDGKICRVCLLV